MTERNLASKDGWHLDKKVPISIIVTVLTQFVAGVIFFAKLEGRVQSLEAARPEERLSQRERDERQDRENAEAFALTRAQLEKMDAKLDRLIESRH